MHKTNNGHNRLLSALPAKIYKRILPKLEQFELVYDTDIYLAGHVIEYVYFLESGIISLLAVVGKNSTLEVGIVGNEGMIGIPVFLGETVSNYRAVVQGAGIAMRMKVKDFIEESDRNADLTRVLKRFTNSMMKQIAQSAACNRYHPIESRMARWLLMTRDRMNSDEFKITQGFLANMLGVRREAVSKVASGLSDDGLISYKRGNLTVNKNKELTRRACLCYKVDLTDMTVAG